MLIAQGNKCFNVVTEFGTQAARAQCLARLHQQHNITCKTKEPGKIGDLLAHSKNAGKIKSNKSQFNIQKDRFYCKGGWLENHVFALLVEIRENRPQISQLAKNKNLWQS